MQRIAIAAVTAGLLLCSPYANAKESEKATKAEKPTRAEKPEKAPKPELFPKDNRTPSQKDFDRTEREVKKEYDRRQEEERKESMRDKSHDGRIPVGKNTSVAPQVNPPGVNIRKTTP